MKKLLKLSVLLLFITAVTCPQDKDTTIFTFGKYKFDKSIDSANYCATMTVRNGSKVIYTDSCDMDMTAINAYDLEGNGRKEILIEYYSGGAHCCVFLNICRITNDKFIILDSLYLGNSFYEVKDLDNDGELEISAYNDMFAYAFTNFAQSRFPLAIYKFKNDKLYLANKEFEDKVYEDIKGLKDELSEYTKHGFDCPKTADEETFNTDAGAVQAILAAIVGDYETIGMTDKGYELINKVYKCPDKDKFIKILKNDYHLK